jgi:hypothetical protein
MKKYTNIILLLLVFFLAISYFTSKKELTNDEVINITKEAYVYGYPLVLMDVTKDVMTNYRTSNGIGGPINQLHHLKKFPDHRFKAVVKPNVDTFYSSGWFDLKEEPMVLDIADTGGRYFMIQFLDAYTNVFFVPGSRTTGTKTQRYVIVGPDWEGKTLKGVKVIKAKTNLIWAIGRTQVNSPADGRNVVSKIQDGYKMTPMSKVDTNYVPPRARGRVRDIPMNAPAFQVRDMDVETFFDRMNKLMIDNPPCRSDKRAMKKFAKIGVEPGLDYSLDNFDTEIVMELKKVPKIAHEQFAEQAKTVGKIVNGWSTLTDIGTYGTNYDLRAVIANLGLGANLPKDAVYPLTMVDSEGEKLSGKYKYVIHFDANNLPPVKAFWSITMYNDESFLVWNSLNRYALGDRDNMKYNEDGSLDIYIQNISPSANKVSNWLQSPRGGFNLVLRMYWPKRKAVIGRYKVPPVVKVD